MMLTSSRVVARVEGPGPGRFTFRIGLDLTRSVCIALGDKADDGAEPAGLRPRGHERGAREANRGDDADAGTEAEGSGGDQEGGGRAGPRQARPQGALELPPCHAGQLPSLYEGEQLTNTN